MFGGGHTSATELAHRLDALLDEIADLGADDLDGLTADGLSERVRQLDAVRDRIEAELVRTVGRWDAERAWAADGARTGASWLGWQTTMSKAAGHRMVKTARLVRDHDRTAKELAAGDLTVAHAEALSAVACGERRPVYADTEDALLDTIAGLSVDQSRRYLTQWRLAADDAVDRAPIAEQHELRRLYVSESFEGTVRLDGFLPPGMGQTVMTALEQLSPPDPVGRPEGVRTASQRMADGLHDLCTQYLAGVFTTGDEPTVVPNPTATVTVVVDTDTLTGDTTPLETARCEVNGTSVPKSVVDRLLCDSAVARAITRGRAHVLELGMSARLFTAAQKKALALRDGGCRWPGCDRPPTWCDAHHLSPHRPRDGTGPTDIDNGILLCRHHHTLTHEAGWQLSRDPATGTVTTTGPDGRTFTRPAAH